MLSMYEIEDVTEELKAFEADEATNEDKVRMAQGLVRAAIGLLQEVVDNTDDQHAKAYIVDHLTIMAGSDHNFLSRDYNLDEWLEDLRRGDEEEDEDEDERREEAPMI